MLTRERFDNFEKCSLKTMNCRNYGLRTSWGSSSSSSTSSTFSKRSSFLSSFFLACKRLQLKKDQVTFHFICYLNQIKRISRTRRFGQEVQTIRFVDDSHVKSMGELRWVYLVYVLMYILTIYVIILFLQLNKPYIEVVLQVYGIVIGVRTCKV